MNDDARWHLDKRVPIALISTLLIQTIALVLFLAGLRYDLTHTMERLTAIELEARLDRTTIADIRTNDAVMHANLADIKVALRRIEDDMARHRNNHQEKGDK